MTVKRRKWGSLTERNGKWVVRWQEDGRRRQKGGFATRNEADHFLGEQELRIFRVGFVPESNPLANAMDIAIEVIDTMRCPKGEVEAIETSDATELVAIDLERLKTGDVVTLELAERPRRLCGTVVDIERDDEHRVRALNISVQLAANQIVGVLGGKKKSEPVGS